MRRTVSGQEGIWDVCMTEMFGLQRTLGVMWLIEFAVEWLTHFTKSDFYL